MNRAANSIATRSAPYEPFRSMAADYHANRLCVFPVDGKIPLVKGFNSWPGLRRETIDRWGSRWPTANLGIGTRGAGLVVLDSDTPTATKLFREIAGETPLRTLTPRGGEHWYFRDPDGAYNGVNRPGNAGYDIKGAGFGDFVVLPGSWSDVHQRAYEITGAGDEATPYMFGALLREVPILSSQAYSNLTHRPIGRTFSIPSASVTRLRASGVVAEGERNTTMFKWCCREARQFADWLTEDGLRELVSRSLAMNSSTFVPPLPAAEVEKTARSAWKYTQKGTNRRRGRACGPICDALVKLDGDARAVALQLYFDQLPDPQDIAFSPSRWANADVIPNWSRRFYQAASDALLKVGELKQRSAGKKGRGLVGHYAVCRLQAPLPVTPLLSLFVGDADALILYLLCVERWGVGETSTLAIRAMTARFVGPLSNWTERRLRRARDNLEEKGLIVRIAQPRRPGRLDLPAQFTIKPPFVPKMPEFAPHQYTPAPLSETRLARSRPIDHKLAQRD